MPDDTPPPMDPVEEYQNSQLLDEDDFVVVDDSDLSDLSDPEELVEEDDSKVTFSGHSGPVFCCNISSQHNLVVSGGEDDKGFVWDISNGQTVFECAGHEDSVTSVGFNHDSSLVVTGDMSGIIQVWDVQSKSRIWDFKTSDDLKWLQWLPESSFLMAGTVCGDAWLWLIPDGNTTFFPSFGVPSSVGKFMNGERVVIGYDDGSIRIWDQNNAVVLQAVVGRGAHKGTVTSLDCDQNGLIISSSVDGSAKLILAASGKVINTFQCTSTAASAEEPDSVESVAFLTNQHAFVTSTVQGSIAVWDIGSHAQRLHFKQESGVVKVICSKDSPHFFTAGLDGVVRLFDGRTGQLESSWKGHVCEILDFDLSSDGQTIVTASEDGKCKVFSVGQR